ncbi:MAG TPA: DUF2293 domain-containing protein [Bryobacteraceae bacterium]|nr:DUF2293 domain-containing protein [Bryobacteraceae bacterium]
MSGIFAPKPKLTLEERVVRSAEAALRDQHHVSAIDVLMRMGLLAESHVASWRQGRIDYLEDMMQVRPDKVGRVLEVFGQWAKSQGLEPVEARYVRTTREGEIELRFTNTKYPGMEQALRAHYVSPKITERRKKGVEKKVTAAPERVVFLPRRDTACSECGVEIESGELLAMEEGQPLCMACAGLGDLEFLGRGDAALTRRATKYSKTRAVVVEWSRSRKRYERQGILAEPTAIQQAEAECAEDADERARDRERDAVARKKEDAVFVEKLKVKLQALFPGCSADEIREIAHHTALRGSGRVGRSAAAKQLDEKAVTLAVAAAIRHRHTKYDELLANGTERADARQRVQGRIEEVLDSWSRSK